MSRAIVYHLLYFLILYTVMLKWFVENQIAKRAIQQQVMIEEDEVEVMPEKVSDAVLDENVDVHLIRKYFTVDAWLVVKDVLDRKKANAVYTCGSCYHDISESDQSPSLICEHCLQWYHMKCVGLSKQPKCKYWFCRGCHASPATE